MVSCHFRIIIVKDDITWLLTFCFTARRPLGLMGKIFLVRRKKNMSQPSSDIRLNFLVAKLICPLQGVHLHRRTHLI